MVYNGCPGDVWEWGGEAGESGVGGQSDHKNNTVSQWHC